MLSSLLLPCFLSSFFSSCFPTKMPQLDTYSLHTIRIMNTPRLSSSALSPYSFLRFSENLAQFHNTILHFLLLVCSHNNSHCSRLRIKRLVSITSLRALSSISQTNILWLESCRQVPIRPSGSKVVPKEETQSYGIFYFMKSFDHVFN